MPHRLRYRRKILLSFLFATLVLVTVGLSFFASFMEMQRQKAWVDHTDKVIQKVNGVLSELKDIQSSQRGYLITGLEDYMAPYHAALPRIEDDMAELGRLISDNTEQQERYNRLKIHVDGRVRIANEVVDAYHKEGQAAAFEMIKSGNGKREMDEARFIVADMIAEEQSLLNDRRHALDLSAKVTTFAGLSGIVICFVILMIVFMMIRKESDQRAKTEESLKKTLDEMENINTETRLIGQMGDYLRSCRTESEAYEMVTANLPAIFPNSYGSVAMFSNSRNILNPVLTWGDAPDGIVHEYELEDCWALRQGRVHPYNGDVSSPKCPHLHKLSDEHMTICLPMQAQGEIIGQLFIGAPKTQRAEVTRTEMGTMRRVTEQISLALANLNLQRVLREQSIKDPLTKLFNRRYLEETLAREVARAQRASSPLAVLIMDIDHFKKVNDTYGHDGGDAVLVAFASVLYTKSRKEDVACRLGGEEFVLAMPGAGEDLARARAEEIRAAVSQLKVKFQNQLICVTVSIGLALYPDHGATPEELITRADEGLYEAKRSGRNRVVVAQLSNEEPQPALS